MINDKVKKWNEYYYPKGYDYVDGMLYFGEKFVSGTPFILCGKTEETSKGLIYYLLRYALDGEQKEMLASSEELQTKKKCAPLLTGRGFKVNDGRLFQRVLHYITACECEYGDQLKTIFATENNGWNEDFSMFAIGKQGITKDKVVDIYTTLTNPKNVDVFRSKGDIEGWSTAVQEILRYELVRFLFYDAMTAPLLKILDLESHTFEHTGKTRSGKSTISKVIASAVGNPKEMLFTAESTKNSIVKYVNEMSDVPTFIEEATSKRAKENVKSAIYDIANGMEKMRSQIDGHLRDDLKTFSAVTHITCEGSIREDMDHAGEMYRCNSLDEMLPYVEGIKEIERAINKNYGFFFIKYIQKIMENRGILEEKYREYWDDIKIRGEVINKNLVESSKNLYAGIMVAGWLCEEVFKDIGVETGEYKSIVQRYFDKCIVENNVELDHVRALKMINDWVAMNDLSFLHDNEDLPDIKIKVSYGVITEGKLIIVWKHFDKIMREWGFNSPLNIAKNLKDEGITKTNTNSVKLRFKMGSYKPEGIAIKLDEMQKILSVYDE